MRAAKGAKIAHQQVVQHKAVTDICKIWDYKRCQIAMTLILVILGDHMCQRNPRGGWVGA